MSVTIKLVLPDKTLRRVTVAKDTTLEALMVMSKRIALLENTPVHLAYLDEDNEMITLGSTSELTEYLEIPTKTKKIFISTEPVTNDQQPQAAPVVEEEEEERSPVERLAAALAKPETVRGLQTAFGESPIVVEAVNNVANAFLSGGLPAAFASGKEQLPLLYAVAEEAIARDTDLESAVKDLKETHNHVDHFPFGFPVAAAWPLFSGGAGGGGGFNDLGNIAAAVFNTGAIPSSTDQPTTTTSTNDQQEQQQPGQKTVHAFVVCDGCDNDPELKKQAKMNGTIGCRGWILGDRYKSVVVHDFDLCSSCKDTGRFDVTHGPFENIPVRNGGGGGRHHGPYCGPHHHQRGGGGGGHHHHHRHGCFPHGGFGQQNNMEGCQQQQPQQQQQRGCRGSRRHVFAEVLQETLKSAAEAVADSAGSDSEVAQIARAIRDSLITANNNNNAANKTPVKPSAPPTVTTTTSELKPAVVPSTDNKPGVIVEKPVVATSTASVTPVATMGGEEVDSSSGEEWVQIDPMVKWSSQLQQLHGLGFTDVAMYIPMLEEEHGDLERVVNRIIRRNA